MVRRQQVVDRLGDLGVLREQRPFFAQPAFQIGDQRSRQALPRLEAGGGGFAVDVALDLEQGIDAPNRLERDRRDLFGVLSLANVLLDIRALLEPRPGERF